MGREEKIEINRYDMNDGGRFRCDRRIDRDRTNVWSDRYQSLRFYRDRSEQDHRALEARRVERGVRVRDNPLRREKFGLVRFELNSNDRSTRPSDGRTLESNSSNDFAISLGRLEYPPRSSGPRAALDSGSDRANPPRYPSFDPFAPKSLRTVKRDSKNTSL